MHLKSSSAKLWSFCSGLRALTFRVLDPGYFETIRSIDPSNKSHNVLGKYPTMHHFVTEMCTHVHISVTKWCIVGYLPNTLWDLLDGSISWLIPWVFASPVHEQPWYYIACENSKTPCLPRVRISSTYATSVLKWCKSLFKCIQRKWINKIYFL